MGKHRESTREFYFNLKFLKALGQLFALVYPKWEWAALWTVITIATAVGREVVTYFAGLISGHFYDAFMSFDENEFWMVMIENVVWYLIMCLFVAASDFFSYLLYLSMRKNAVTKMHALYFDKNAYYRINCIDDKGVDNPDQRITQDIERACNILAVNIIPVFLLAPFTIGWYSYQTWVVTGPWGVGMMLLYFLIGLVGNRLLLSPLAKWSARVERAEGNFRYKHVSVRDHSEEAAFYKAEDFESLETASLFTILLSRLKIQILWKLPVNFFKNYYNNLGATLSFAVQFFPFFVFHTYDDVDPSEIGTIINNNAFVLIYLLASFMNITDLAITIGDFAGFVQRVTEFENVAKAYSKENYDGNNGPAALEVNEKRDNNVNLFNLSITPPTENDSLIKEVSVNVNHSDHLLITGPSGVGKTSLLRCLAHLWPTKDGSVSMGNLPRGIMFLPQKPYFPVGGLSLKQQVVFPSHASTINDTEDSRIISILQSLHLSRLLVLAGDLTGKVDFEWQEQLSPGEQQRLSLARVFYHQPSLVVLDEATASLSENAEREVYQLLRKDNIGYLSTGHRSSLFSFHDEVLQLGAEGTVSTFPTNEIRY